MLNNTKPRLLLIYVCSLCARMRFLLARMHYSQLRHAAAQFQVYSELSVKILEEWDAADGGPCSDEALCDWWEKEGQAAFPDWVFEKDRAAAVGTALQGSLILLYAL